MQAHQTYMDIRKLIVIVLKLLPKSDERHLIVQEIASRHGMVELLNDRVGSYQGGDG